MKNHKLATELQEAYDRLIESYCEIGSSYAYTTVIPFVNKYSLTIVSPRTSQDWGFYDFSSGITLRSWMSRLNYVPIQVDPELSREFVEVILPILLEPLPGEPQILLGTLIMRSLSSGRDWNLKVNLPVT